MAKHDIGPFFIKLFYNVAARQHVHQFSIRLQGDPEPGDPLMAYTRASGTVDLTIAMTLYVASLLPFLTPSDAVTEWACYKKETPDAEPVWLGAGIVVGGIGTAVGGTTNIAGMVSITYRTSLGGRWRFQLMETIVPSNALETPAYIAANDPYQDSVVYLTSSDNVVVGRDGGYPLTPMRAIGKENDKLRRKYL